MDDFAKIIVECLRHVAVGEVLTIGNKEAAVARLNDAAAEVISARRRTMLLVDDFHVSKPWRLGVVEPSTCKRGAPAAIEWLSIGKINCVVLGEVAVEDYVHQPPLSRSEHPRHISQWRGQLAIARNNPHTPGPLGH